jgi:hypothetical protein
VFDAHRGTVINMTAQPVGFSATIVAAHALAFLALAYLVTLLRHGGRGVLQSRRKRQEEP